MLLLQQITFGLLIASSVTMIAFTIINHLRHTRSLKSIPTVVELEALVLLAYRVHIQGETEWQLLLTNNLKTYANEHPRFAEIARGLVHK